MPPGGNLKVRSSISSLSPISSVTGSGYGFFSYSTSAESQVGPARTQGVMSAPSCGVLIA